MNAIYAASIERQLRATTRIARHCAALERLSGAREPARARLETQVGPQFATFLVCALRGRPTRHTGWLAA